MVHWCLGDLRRGLAPFWGGEDDSRHRLGQPSAARLVCQVLQQELQSLNGVSSLLPEHHHVWLDAYVGEGAWSGLGQDSSVRLGSNRQEGWDRSADQGPSGSVPRHQGGRGGTPGTPLGLTSTSLLVLSTGWF